MAKAIELTQGCHAIVDDEDFQKVSNYKWHANKTKNGFIYARRTIVFPRKNGKQPQIKQYLHRFILGIEDKNILIDFKNNDPLDCRKSNLIISSIVKISFFKRIFISRLHIAKSVTFISKI